MTGFQAPEPDHILLVIELSHSIQDRFDRSVRDRCILSLAIPKQDNYNSNIYTFNPMKTQGEIESAICESMSRFEQEYLGRGPKDIHAYLIDDLVIIRLKGVLTVVEQHLIKTLPPEKGRDLIKEVRTHLIEIARPTMEVMIQEITGAKVLSLHHDISTLTGEEVVLFTLSESPSFREIKKR